MDSHVADHFALIGHLPLVYAGLCSVASRILALHCACHFLDRGLWATEVFTSHLWSKGSQQPEAKPMMVFIGCKSVYFLSVFNRDSQQSLTWLGGTPVVRVIIGYCLDQYYRPVTTQGDALSASVGQGEETTLDESNCNRATTTFTINILSK